MRGKMWDKVSVPYALLYDPQVIEEDLPPLPLNVQSARSCACKLRRVPPEEHDNSSEA